MSSKTAKPVMHSAAWRISLWATLAFTFGTVIVFYFLDGFVASDIQRRSDVWLSGEVEVLADVAERTPDDALYGRVLGEVAELAAHEVPNRTRTDTTENRSVFFVQMGPDGSLKLWVGVGDAASSVAAIRQTRIAPGRPSDVRLPGFSIPFRVASVTLPSGSHIYLGLSERDERRVLRNLRQRFFWLWLSIVLLGFAIVFLTTRRTLSHVRKITEVASRVGHSGLNTRVPTTRRSDEIAQLAHTLNGMLDRIEISVHQLHTITDALAHDLRSPITAIRGKLERALSSQGGEHSDAVVNAIEELDRLTAFLDTSLDVAEAKADALRLSRTSLDLDEQLRAMVEVYEPSMAEKSLTLELESHGPVPITGDANLLHRMIANLFENELKHARAGSTVKVTLGCHADNAVLTVQDNGAGFDAEVLPALFERRVKGKSSSGYGLGLAFVNAVVRAHGGSITAANSSRGGAYIHIDLPLASEGAARQQNAMPS